MSDMPTRWPEARGRRGILATPHALASEAGITVIRRGGNAVDAAIAAAATLAVVYPHMNGIGGDNFWLLYDARRGTVRALNAAGRSAEAADLATYQRYGSAIAPRGGAAALTVPGAVSGWWEAYRYSQDELGSSIAWATLLDHAIRHARQGFVPSDGQRRTTAVAPGLFDRAAPEEVRRSLWPIYHPERLTDGPFVQSDLARTLGTIADGGAEEFYRGSLGRRIAGAARRAGSPLAFEDFTRHRAEWVKPLGAPYRGGVAMSLPPPTQGFAALAILALLDGFDVGALDEADYIHVVVEATKLALEDRDRFLADPSVMRVPVDHCLDPERLAARRREIAMQSARPVEGGSVAGDTIAIVTADGDGNAVSVIQSLYHEFGSGVIAGDTGVLLQNRGAFFSLDPSHPNCLAPRKHTAHTLVPSMYLVAGRPRLVYGTMGGDGQPQTQAALVTRIVDRGLSPQAAIEAPRWLLGRTWGEASRALRLEDRFGAEVARSLQQRGHDVKVVEPWSDVMGHAQVVRLADDGMSGASDPRADGAALAV